MGSKLSISFSRTTRYSTRISGGSRGNARGFQILEPYGYFWNPLKRYPEGSRGSIVRLTYVLGIKMWIHFLSTKCFLILLGPRGFQVLRVPRTLFVVQRVPWNSGTPSDPHLFIMNDAVFDQQHISNFVYHQFQDFHFLCPNDTVIDQYMDIL